MSIEALLRELRRNPAFIKNVKTWERIPPRPARYAYPPVGEPVEPELVEALRRRGTWPLYTHQALAVRLALEGKNPVIVTGTASGKTLCYDLPVLQTLRSDLTASALYLFPTKALAQDQLAGLNQLAGELKGHRPPINLYDGDTPAGRRSAMRSAGGILLSNPDML
ncbi:MAG: DEAD/DEAH box helicase, partial [Anaerolineales bacterium]|nr:DEAD/DEAH box helicase [Anaerolineales bacterium]